MLRVPQKLHMLPGLLSAPCSEDRAFQEAFSTGFAHTGLQVTGRDTARAKYTPKAVLRLLRFLALLSRCIKVLKQTDLPLRNKSHKVLKFYISF